LCKNSTEISKKDVATIFRVEEMLHSGFLLGLFFGLEDRGEMLLRNIC
jgi:hypothetical protein